MTWTGICKPAMAAADWRPPSVKLYDTFLEYHSLRSLSPAESTTLNSNI